MFTCSFVGQEDTGSFSYNVNTDFVPFQVSWVFLSSNADGFAVNNGGRLSLQRCRRNDRELSRTSACTPCIQRPEIVDTNDFDVRTFLSSTENNTADTAKTVDTYFDSHIFHQLFVSE